MKKIILLGPPGSGKGTIAQWLENDYQAIHFSTGKIFRSLANNTSEIAQQIQEIVSNGNLVSDNLTNNLIKSELDNLAASNQMIVLDGYPRTLNQADFLLKNFKIDLVINLNCSNETILERLTNRLVCTAADHTFHKLNKKPKVEGVCDYDNSPLYQRKDDQTSVIKKRLDIYEQQTAPLVEFFKKQDLLVDINGDQAVEIVKKELKKILNLV